MKKFKLLSILAFAVLGIPQIADAQTMYLTDVKVEQGSTVLLPVNMYDAGEDIVSMQIDLTLPGGMVADYENATYNASRKVDHSLSGNLLASGSFRFASISTTNSAYKGDDGELFYVPIQVSESLSPGKYIVFSSKGQLTVKHVVEKEGKEEVEFKAIDVSDSEATITVAKPEPITPYVDFQFYSKNIKVAEGKAITLLMSLNNSAAVQKFSFDIKLPVGISVNWSDDLEYYNITNVDGSRLSSDVEGEYDGEKYIPGETNVFQISYTSARGKSIAAGDDVVFQIVLDNAASKGEYEVLFDNQVLDGESSESYAIKLTVGEDEDAPTVNDIKVIKCVKPDGDLGDNEIALDENNNWHARKITLADGVKFDSDHLIDVAEFSLVRPFPHQNWQAWFAPFAVSSDIFAQAINFVGTKVDGDETVLVFEEVTGELEPNTPYIIRPNGSGEQGETSKSLTGIKSIKLQKSEAGSTPATKYTLCGTYTEKTDMATSGAYALKDGNFHPASSDAVVLKPFRIYLQATEGSAAEKPSMLRIVVEGDVEGIESVENDSDWDGTYYDLQGRPVQNSGKGLYIMKGKKVYIK